MRRFVQKKKGTCRGGGKASKAASKSLSKAAAGIVGLSDKSTLIEVRDDSKPITMDTGEEKRKAKDVTEGRAITKGTRADRDEKIAAVQAAKEKRRAGAAKIVDKEVSNSGGKFEPRYKNGPDSPDQDYVKSDEEKAIEKEQRAPRRRKGDGTTTERKKAAESNVSERAEKNIPDEPGMRAQDKLAKQRQLDDRAIVEDMKASRLDQQQKFISAEERAAKRKAELAAKAKEVADRKRKQKEVGDTPEAATGDKAEQARKTREANRQIEEKQQNETADQQVKTKTDLTESERKRLAATNALRKRNGLDPLSESEYKKDLTKAEKTRIAGTMQAPPDKNNEIKPAEAKTKIDTVSESLKGIMQDTDDQIKFNRARAGYDDSPGADNSEAARARRKLLMARGDTSGALTTGSRPMLPRTREGFGVTPEKAKSDYESEMVDWKTKAKEKISQNLNREGITHTDKEVQDLVDLEDRLSPPIDRVFGDSLKARGGDLDKYNAISGAYKYANDATHRIVGKTGWRGDKEGFEKQIQFHKDAFARQLNKDNRLSDAEKTRTISEYNKQIDANKEYQWSDSASGAKTPKQIEAREKAKADRNNKRRRAVLDARLDRQDTVRGSREEGETKEVKKTEKQQEEEDKASVEKLKQQKQDKLNAATKKATDALAEIKRKPSESADDYEERLFEERGKVIDKLMADYANQGLMLSYIDALKMVKSK